MRRVGNGAPEVVPDSVSPPFGPFARFDWRATGVRRSGADTLFFLHRETGLQVRCIAVVQYILVQEGIGQRHFAAMLIPTGEH